MELALCRALEQFWIHATVIAGTNPGFLQNLPNALERYRQGFKVSRLPNDPKREQTLLHIHQIIGAGPEYGCHLVIRELLSLAKYKARAVQNEVQNFILMVRSDALLRLVREERLTRCANCKGKGERQFPFQDYLDHPERCATQGVRVAGTRGNNPHSKATDHRIALVGKSDGATGQIAWDGIVQTDRAIMVVNRVRNFIGLALCASVEAPDGAL